MGGQFGASEDTINTTLTFVSTYKVLVMISIYLNVCFWATNERKPNIHSLLSPFWSSVTAGQVVCSGFLDVIHWKLLFNAAEKTLMMGSESEPKLCCYHKPVGDNTCSQLQFLACDTSEATQLVMYLRRRTSASVLLRQMLAKALLLGHNPLMCNYKSSLDLECGPF